MGHQHSLQTAACSANNALLVSPQSASIKDTSKEIVEQKYWDEAFNIPPRPWQKPKPSVKIPDDSKKKEKLMHTTRHDPPLPQVLFKKRRGLNLTALGTMSSNYNNQGNYGVFAGLLLTLVLLASVLLILLFKEQISKHTLKGSAARNKKKPGRTLKRSCFTFRVQ